MLEGGQARSYKELGKLSSESANYHALKKHSNLGQGLWLGMGKHQWMKNGRKYNVKE